MRNRARGEDYYREHLLAGQRVALSRAITAVENNSEDARNVFKVINGTEWNVLPVDAPEATISMIGQKLLTDFIFPFEYASIVLLLAMIGAAILIRERKIDDEEEVQS